MEPQLPTTSPVDLRQALYFVTVVEELSFSRAAARLHISAPALSQQVKALERHLGVQLLVRDTRHVQATAAGAVFARASRRLLQQSESAVRQTRRSSRLVQGRLLLAVPRSTESGFEPLLTGFHADYPSVEFQIATMGHAEAIRALRIGTVDACLTWSWLLHRAGNTGGLRWSEVAPTEVLAALHPAHPLNEGERVPRGHALRGTSVVLFERDYSPLAFDYCVEELYGPGYADPPVHEVSVTLRVQEAMARRLATTRTLAPLSRPVAELHRGTWEVRPFDPPWLMDGRVVWEPGNRSTALMAFVAAATTPGQPTPPRRRSG